MASTVLPHATVAFPSSFSSNVDSLKDQYDCVDYTGKLVNLERVQVYASLLIALVFRVSEADGEMKTQ